MALEQQTRECKNAKAVRTQPSGGQRNGVPTTAKVEMCVETLTKCLTPERAPRASNLNRGIEGKFEDERIIYDVLQNDADLLLTNIFWPSTEISPL